MADEYIQFMSNIKDFNPDTKLVFNSKTTDLDILKYYISIQTPINKKITSLLEKVIDVKKLEQNNLALFKMDEDSFLKELNSSVFSKTIEKYLATEYKSNLKEVIDIFKSYSFNRYLLENNIMAENAVGYYKILFPTRKKQLKKAILK